MSKKQQHTAAVAVGSRFSLAAHPFANVPQAELGRRLPIACDLNRNFLLLKIESLNALQGEFNNDSRSHKTDLMRGVYQTKDGGPYVFPSVKMVSSPHKIQKPLFSLTVTRHDKCCSTIRNGSMNILHLTWVRPSFVI